MEILELKGISVRLLSTGNISVVINPAMFNDFIKSSNIQTDHNGCIFAIADKRTSPSPSGYTHYPLQQRIKDGYNSRA